MVAQPINQNKTRILLVDDDPIVLRIYADGLSRQGFEVETANDGLMAMQALRAAKPDLLVLDQMMPKLSGAEVLRFVRSQPELAALPVVVLSNAYMNELAWDASARGAQKGLLKTQCTPRVLTGVIRDLLADAASPEDSSILRAARKAESTHSTAPAPAPATGEKEEIGMARQARRDFLEKAPATCAELRNLFQALSQARNEVERGIRLQNFYRKVHFVTATAGLAECHQLGQMASAFEALLFEVMNKPSHFNPSVLRTMALTVDFLGVLLERARDSVLGTPLSGQALAVDDDPMSNRLVVSALRHAHLRARSTEEPQTALRWLQAERFDLVLLDVEMPGMDGFELCKRLRALPGYQQTPVIYVTSHGDFESRTKSVLSGGDDLIAKPVFAMELAVKAVAHLLKRQMRGNES
jgi:CheY-like chemotaxis protein